MSAFDAPIASVVQCLLDAAETLYARAAPGIAALPLDCRVAIHAARLLYAEIGHRVLRPGFDPIARRTVVPGKRRAVLLGRAFAELFARRRPADGPALPAAAFLVEAAAALALAAPSPTTPGLRPDRQMIWVFDLIERLARAEEASGPVVIG